MLFAQFKHQRRRNDIAGRIFVVLSFLGVVFATAGCGGEKDNATKPTTRKPVSTTNSAKGSKETTPTKPTTRKPKKNIVKKTATGTLTGTIVFDGAVPKLEPLVKKGDQKVKNPKVCSNHAVPNESLLVNENNKGIQNVFVYLRRAPKGVSIPQPGDPVVLDQQNCRFKPHASVVRSEQIILVKSEDDATHNIHTFPSRNLSFNQSMSGRNRKGVSLICESSEVVPMKIKCDIHSWMEAYILPLDHPFGTLTNSDGRFEIKGLPVGKHKIRIWHERAGYLSDKKGYEFEIRENETTNISLKFSAEKFGGS